MAACPATQTAQWEKLLVRVRANDKTLTMLQLDANRFGDEGAGQVASALTNNNSLTHLSLAANDIR